jgi:AcrR family transcriptional regulator
MFENHEPGANPLASQGVSDPKTRIVLATIDCLQRYGVAGTTVRRIAETGAVNLASINYHFGSKDALLQAAFTRTLQDALPSALVELSGSIARQRGNIEAGTREFFRHYLPRAVAYPRIAVAQLHDALLEQDYSGAAVKAIREFVDKFYHLVAPAMLQRTEAEQRTAVRHVWATVCSLTLLPQLFGVPGVALSGEEMVGRLCATLFESL